MFPVPHFCKGKVRRLQDCFPMLSLILSVKMMLYLATVRWSPGHTRSIPLVAPVPGATTGSWVEQWKSVAPKLDCPSSGSPDRRVGPSCPFRVKEDGSRPAVRRRRHVAWLVQLLVNLGHEEAVTPCWWNSCCQGNELSSETLRGHAFFTLEPKALSVQPHITCVLHGYYRHLGSLPKGGL